jgi:hypothetical protein
LAIFRPVIEKTQQEQSQGTTEIDALREELEVKLEKYMDQMRDITNQEFSNLKKKLKEKVEQDKKKKQEMDLLYEKLRVLKQQSKMLQLELHIYRPEGMTSIHKVLRNEKANKTFLEFCHELKCEEMLTFWNETEIYKKSSMNLKEKAKSIYDKYLSSKSEKALNVNSKTISSIESQLNNPTKDMFNSTQKEMLLLLSENAFRKFCSSSKGKATIDAIELE